jgi:DNA-binding NarL/FixJ family response regulator
MHASPEDDQAGDAFIADAMAPFLCDARLSEREQQILVLGAHGLADKEISTRLSLAYTTIKSYWSRICFKVGANNRQLAIGKLVTDLARRVLIGEELKRSSGTETPARPR